MTISEAIDEAVSKAASNGISVERISTGWEKANEVVHMGKPLAAILRQKLDADDRLRYWLTEATPHNMAEEGYTDDFKKVVILFPR